jgi:heme exporter protein A
LIVCSVNELGVFRRNAWLLHRLNFTVTAGECWLITGQNGSGKTTLLRTLAGLCLPDTGHVVYSHQTHNPLSLLYIGSPPAKIPELSVIENCRFQALLRWGKQPDAAGLVKALRYWGIDDLAEERLENLSQGQQQRVSLALLLLGPATLWLLDEPSTGLDAAGTETLWALCRQHQARGGSILMATHQAPINSIKGSRAIQLGVHGDG